MISRQRAFFAALCAAAAALAACWFFAKPQTVPLAVETDAGVRHLFRVEIAATSAAQHRGLMFRDTLPDDAGMLFVFTPPQPVSFWMKNTRIALDILFIDATGRIVGVHARAVPGALASILSPGPVRAVLEINGGLARRFGIAVGDRVFIPSLFPAGTSGL